MVYACFFRTFTSLGGECCCMKRQLLLHYFCQQGFGQQIQLSSPVCVVHLKPASEMSNIANRSEQERYIKNVEVHQIAFLEPSVYVCRASYSHCRTLHFLQPNQHKLSVASQLRDTFTHHELVAVYHYNDLNTQEWNGLRLKLAQSGIQMKVFPSKISIKALEGTKYGNISPLFRGCTAVAYAKEASAAKDLLSVTGSESKLHLLGGVVEDEMMTPLGLKSYSELPSLEGLQQAILGTLNQTQMTLRWYLQRTPQRLTQLLKQISDSSSAH